MNGCLHNTMVHSRNCQKEQTGDDQLSLAQLVVVDAGIILVVSSTQNIRSHGLGGGHNQL